MQSTRIQKLFERTRSEGRAALIGYLTAGDPTPEKTPELVAALERGGVDLIELGVPFSDPIADGPVIQRGAARALAAGTTVAKVLEIARTIRKSSEIPLLLFTYLNPVLRYGLEKLAADAKAGGIDGCLLTDVSVEEAGPYVVAMRAAGLDTVFLAAPTSTDRRLKLVAEYSTGFVYLVSRTGVTGERSDLSDSLAPLLEKMRSVTKLPLAAGFGISTPDQAGAVSKMADGVVVGSAIVRQIEKDPKWLGGFRKIASGRNEEEMTPEEARRLMEQSREEIDALDRDMVAILNRRTRMVHQIGQAKEALELPVFEANREEAVYKNISAANQGPIPGDALKRIFEGIIEEMSALQRARREQSTAKS